MNIIVFRKGLKGILIISLCMFFITPIGIAFFYTYFIPFSLDTSVMLFYSILLVVILFIIITMGFESVKLKNDRVIRKRLFAKNSIYYNGNIVMHIVTLIHNDKAEKWIVLTDKEFGNRKITYWQIINRQSDSPISFKYSQAREDFLSNCVKKVVKNEIIQELEPPKFKKDKEVEEEYIVIKISNRKKIIYDFISLIILYFILIPGIIFDYKYMNFRRHSRYFLLISTILFTIFYIILILVHALNKTEIDSESIKLNCILFKFSILISNIEDYSFKRIRNTDQYSFLIHLYNGKSFKFVSADKYYITNFLENGKNNSETTNNSI